MAYPKTINTNQLIIRYKGLFDHDGLYNMIVRWMKTRRYWFHEEVYKHKVPSPHGAEQEFTFTGEKKISDYIMYSMRIAFHLWDMNEVEVIKDNAKRTLTNARMEIIMVSTVNVDYEKRMEKSKIWAAISDVYYKYFLKEDIESIHHDTIYYRMFKLHNAIKEFLDMGAKGNEYEGYMGDNA